MAFLLLRTAQSLSAGHDPHGMYDVGDVALDREARTARYVQRSGTRRVAAAGSREKPEAGRRGSGVSRSYPFGNARVHTWLHPMEAPSSGDKPLAQLGPAWVVGQSEI